MKKYLKFMVCIFWIVLWQLGAEIISNPILFAGPLEVLASLWEHMHQEQFQSIVWHSYSRIIGGFMSAFALGVLLGIGVYRIKWLGVIMAPLVAAIKAVPVASFVVLLLIWTGSKGLSFWCCLLIAFPLIYENTIAGLESTDKKMLEMAKVYKIAWRKRAFYIYRPALLPYLVSGSKTAIGMSFKSGVAAEIIGIPLSTMGEQIYLSKIYLDTAGVFGWTLLVIVLSIATEKILIRILKSYEKKQNMFFEIQTSRETSNSAEDKGKTGTIKFTHLEKTYQGAKVLSDINFVIEKGCIYCLMGNSGVGKTTLFRIMMGLTPADAGGEISGLSGCKISVVFQENRLCESIDAISNIQLAAGTLKKDTIRTELMEILPREAMDKEIAKQSGGMKRRTAVCRAMLAESDVILMDEPFTGLDSENRKKVIAYILKKREGRTLIVATHQEEDALLLGGRVIRIKEK